MEEFLRKILRKVRIFIYRFLDNFTPKVTHRQYCGLDLYYSNGPSIIDRIRFLSPTKIYEPLVSQKIVSLLKAKENPVLIDIGANIGLISFYAVAHIPSLRVYAFEPSVHARAFMEMTVSRNFLEEKISVSPNAIANNRSIIYFYTDSKSQDVSGDGLMDTHRSLHPKKKIQIETTTLDDFIKTQQTKVDVIKIDIEGAELWALEGAKETIEKYRPVILFEMNKLNLAVYPYSEKEIFAFFDSQKYRVVDMNENPINAEKFRNEEQFDDMYIAYPHK